MSKNAENTTLLVHNLSRQKTYILLFTVGALFFALAGWLWWRNVYAHPSRVFWGMIENNLAMTGVTKRTSESGQSGLSEQFIEFGFGDDTLAHVVTRLEQPGPEGDSEVVTETLATTNAAYNRYTSVKTPAKGIGGNDLDFSNVLGVWGKAEIEDTESGQPADPGQFLSEYMLGVVPYGNLPAASRQELVEFMRANEVYKPDYTQLEKLRSESGALVYVFPVSIKPAAYIKMLKQFSQAAGLGDAEMLDASQYEDAPEITLQFAVEPYSRNLRNISYGEQDGSRQEEYFSHGVKPGVKIPEETIPLIELQQRLQIIQ